MKVDLTWGEVARLLSALLHWSSPQLVVQRGAPPAPAWWWVAPAVTGAAVLVALFTAIRSLGLQKKALADNRALRVHDDVREVLAEALRDLSALSRGVNGALRIAGGRPLFRHWQAKARDDNEQTRSWARNQLGPAEAEIERARAVYEEALNGVILQAERLELLLGPLHQLTGTVGAAQMHVLFSGVSDAWFPWLNEGDDLELAKRLKAADDAIVKLRKDFRYEARGYVQESLTQQPPTRRRLGWPQKASTTR